MAPGLLGRDAPGGVELALLVAVTDALLGLARGLLASAFAATVFQAGQSMPAVLPLLLCSLLVGRACPRSRAGWSV